MENAAEGMGSKLLGRAVTGLSVTGMVLLSPGTLNDGEDEWVARRNARSRREPEPEALAGGAGKGKKPHGNTAGNQPAELYALSDAKGHFLKWGVSQNAATRYSQRELANSTVKVVATGTRADMLWLERCLVETIPGSRNHEPWAGIIH
jgi:hypothetical protein